MRSNELSKTYEVNHIKQGFKPINHCYRDKNGILEAPKDDIINIWQDYFSKLLHEEQHERTNFDNEVETHGPNIMEEPTIN